MVSDGIALAHQWTDIINIAMVCGIMPVTGVPLHLLVMVVPHCWK